MLFNTQPVSFPRVSNFFPCEEVPRTVIEHKRRFPLLAVTGASFDHEFLLSFRRSVRPKAAGLFWPRWSCSSVSLFIRMGWFKVEVVDPRFVAPSPKYRSPLCTDDLSPYLFPYQGNIKPLESVRIVPTK